MGEGGRVRTRLVGWRTAQALTPVTAPALVPYTAKTVEPTESVALPEHSLLGVDWNLSYVFFLIYIFSITTYRLPLGTPGMIGAVACLALQRDRFRFPPILVWHGLLTLWSGVSYMQSTDRDISWETLMLTGKLWLIILVAVNALRTRSQIRFFAAFYLACFALFPVRGAFANFFFVGYSLDGRAVWNQVFSNPNDLAGVALLFLALSLGFFYAFGGWTRSMAIGGIAVLPVLILLTQSRGAFIALGAFLLLALALTRRRLRTLAFVAVIGGAMAMFMPEKVWSRFGGLRHATNVESLNEVDSEGSARQRFEIWKVAATIASEHPVFGTGVGTYADEHLRVAARPTFDPTAAGRRDAHSTYLSFAAETGIPGLALFLLLAGTTLIRAERARRRQPPGAWTSPLLCYLELGYVVYLIAGIWGSYDQLAYGYVHLALIAAVVESAREFASSTRAVTVVSRRAIVIRSSLRRRA
jgi:O-antigen ligase